MTRPAQFSVVRLSAFFQRKHPMDTHQHGPVERLSGRRGDFFGELEARCPVAWIDAAC